MRDEISEFRNAGVQPLGVNPASVDAHARYAAKMRFGFPLLSDPDRAVARAYGALKEDGKGIQRTVYGIDRAGAVVFAARGGPPVAELLAAFTA